MRANMMKACVIEAGSVFILRHRCTLTLVVKVDDVIIGGGFVRGLKAIEAVQLTMRKSHGSVTLRREGTRLFK